MYVERKSYSNIPFLRKTLIISFSKLKNYSNFTMMSGNTLAYIPLQCETTNTNLNLVFFLFILHIRSEDINDCALGQQVTDKTWNNNFLTFGEVIGKKTSNPLAFQIPAGWKVRRTEGVFSSNILNFHICHEGTMS